MRDHLILYVNGLRHEVRGSDAFVTLSRFLREKKRATGTKIVCEEGDCGACTVLIGRADDGAMVYRPVNSCVQLLFQLDSTHVVTVEGLRHGDDLTPVQQAMVDCHGAQCGYCTPGFIVAMTALYEDRDRAVTETELREGLTGNLCRCTGYEPIIKAGLSVDRSCVKPIGAIYDDAGMIEEITTRRREPISISAGDRHYHRPSSIDDAVRIRADHPGTVIVQGATDFGVWCTKRLYRPERVMTLDAIDGLDEIRAENRHLVIGGRVSLSAFDAAIRETIPSMAEIMDRFGSPQIRNAGTLAGNIVNASPIADTVPLLFVMEADLELTGANGVRTVPITSFYRGYKEFDLRDDEIVTNVTLPLPADDEIVRLYKVSKRSHLDISTFTAAIRMTVRSGSIAEARIACGGVGPVVLRLPATERFLRERSFDRATFEEAGTMARDEITPISDVRGSRDYRLQLAKNILLRFFHEITEERLAESA